MPEKTGKKCNFTQPQYAQEQKRNLIESLESLRGSRNRDSSVYVSSSQTPESMQKELEEARRELQLSRSANTILENDLRRMEQKALDAIAENGQLKQSLDKARQSGNALTGAVERESLLAELAQSRHDHFMLTQALIDSENELSRLTLTLEKVLGKFCAA